MNKIGLGQSCFFTLSIKKGDLLVEEQYFVIPNGKGGQRCKAILTFDSDVHNKSYVLYVQVDESGNEISEEILRGSFEYDDNDEIMNFAEIETEEENNMVDEVFATFFDDEEVQYFTITDENDEEIDCEVIHTFYSEQFDKSYVFYVLVTDEPLDDRDIFAAAFTAGEDGEIVDIHPIETEEEWQVVESVLQNM